MNAKKNLCAGLVTLVIFSTVGFVAVPRWIQDHRAETIQSSESEIVRFLKALHIAQFETQRNWTVDRNRDLVGEFAFMGEITDEREPLDPEIRSINDPPLSRYSPIPMGKGIYRTRGYYFRIYLPGVDGEPQHEPDPEAQDTATPVDAGMAAKAWWCLAWPVSHGSTGLRCYFINQDCCLVSSAGGTPPYSGLDHPPLPDAAGKPYALSAPAWQCVHNKKGRDGQRWILTH